MKATIIDSIEMKKGVKGKKRQELKASWASSTKLDKAKSMLLDNIRQVDPNDDSLWVVFFEVDRESDFSTMKNVIDSYDDSIRHIAVINDKIAGDVLEITITGENVAENFAVECRKLGFTPFITFI